jgi:hypothetical protein
MEGKNGNSIKTYDDNKILSIESDIDDIANKLEKVSFQLEVFSSNVNKLNSRADEEISRRESCEKMSLQNYHDIKEILSKYGSLMGTLEVHEGLHREYATQMFGIKELLTKEIFNLKEQTMREMSTIKELNLAQIKVKEGMFQAAGLVPKVIALIISISAAFYAYDEHKRKAYELELKHEQQVFEQQRLLRQDKNG